MRQGQFCFLSDQYYEDFPDGKLMRNKEAAFLIQNMCPVTHQYIKEVYKDKYNNVIQIDNRIANDVIKNAREILAKVKRGANIIFPDVIAIYNSLNRQLAQEKIDNKQNI